MCEYYDRNAKPGELAKCQHSKNKKLVPAKGDTPEKSIRLSCTLTNCPFVTGK